MAREAVVGRNGLGTERRGGRPPATGRPLPGPPREADESSAVRARTSVRPLCNTRVGGQLARRCGRVASVALDREVVLGGRHERGCESPEAVEGLDTYRLNLGHFS